MVNKVVEAVEILKARAPENERSRRRVAGFDAAVDRRRGQRVKAPAEGGAAPREYGWFSEQESATSEQAGDVWAARLAMDPFMQGLANSRQNDLSQGARRKISKNVAV